MSASSHARDPEIGAEGSVAALARAYFAHERVILGCCMTVLVLVAWEGFARGWWADALHPMLGAPADRLRLKPIFISSPTLVGKAAFQVFFVTGEMWRDLARSSLGYCLGLAVAIALGTPLGLAAGWYRRLSYAIEPFLSALNATPQVVFFPLIVIWFGTGIHARALIIFRLPFFRSRSARRLPCAPPIRVSSGWQRASPQS